MRSFFLIFILILPFLSHADESDQDGLPGTGTIIGRVGQAHIKEVYGVDDTMANVRVRLRGTTYGTITDSTGVFVISSVAVGYYELNFFTIGYVPYDLSVEVRCDEIVDVGDVFLSIEHPYYPSHYYIWPRFETVRKIEIELISDSILHNREDLVQFCYRYTCLPSTRNGNTYRICLSDSSLNFQCKVAGYGELNINLDEEMEIDGVYQINLDSLFTQYITCTQELLFEHIPNFSHHISRNQWIADDYSAEHDYIDISHWGDRDLVDWGYINHQVFYDENNELKILLVYHKWAVLLGSEDEPLIFNFSFPVKRFYSSPNCRYLLALESIGYQSQGGDAQFLDTFTGESVCFDPTPDNPEPDPAVAREIFLLGSGTRIRPYYLISNKGGLVRIDTDRLHFYDEDFSITLMVPLDEMQLSVYNARIALNGDSLLVVGVIGDSKFVAVLFDILGNIIKRVDLESIDDCFNHALLSISPDADQILLYQEHISLFEITRLYNTNGQIQREWPNRYFRAFVYSPSGNLICCYSDSLFENEQLDLFLTETLERILTIHDTHRLESRPDLSVISRILGISDNGYFIVKLFSEMKNAMDLQPIRSAHNTATELRLALFDIAGNIIWLSPCFNYDQVPSRYTISSDGPVLSYMDGIFLHFITFEHDNHNLVE